jgi:hypothetical protein
MDIQYNKYLTNSNENSFKSIALNNNLAKAWEEYWTKNINVEKNNNKIVSSVQSLKNNNINWAPIEKKSIEHFEQKVDICSNCVTHITKCDKCAKFALKYCMYSHFIEIIFYIFIGILLAKLYL